MLMTQLGKADSRTQLVVLGMVGGGTRQTQENSRWSWTWLVVA